MCTIQTINKTNVLYRELCLHIVAYTTVHSSV